MAMPVPKSAETTTGVTTLNWRVPRRPLAFQGDTTDERLARQQRFQRVVSLLVELAQQEAREVRGRNEEASDAHYLVFGVSEDPQTMTRMAELSPSGFRTRPQPATVSFP